MSREIRLRMNERMRQQTPYAACYRQRAQDGSIGQFTSFLYATPETLQDVVQRRALGEDEYYPLSRPPREKPLWFLIERDGVTLKNLHHACFISFLALKSNACSVDVILGDKGLIHEMVHHLHTPNEPLNPSKKELAEMARSIEEAIPGHIVKSGRQDQHQGHFS